MKVSLVIPNWNGEEKLKLNLPKVLKTKGVAEFIVVDDGSTDGSVSLLKEFKEINLVIRKKNGGFSSAVNDGFKVASGDLVFLLNSDAVPEVECVEKVTPLFEDDNVFSVGFNTGGNWAWASFKDGFFWHKQVEEKSLKVHETMWASGGSSIFRKSIWNELEGLDELMNPFYEEDVDIGYRARKRGYINLWSPDARVEHYKQKGVIEENFSKKFVSTVAQRNQLIFIWKNITSNRLFKEHLKNLVKMLIVHPKYWIVFMKALILLPQILKKRRVEIREMKFTDEEVISKF